MQLFQPFLDLEEKPTLFFEFHGTESNVAADAEMVKEIAQGRFSDQMLINLKVTNVSPGPMLAQPKNGVDCGRPDTRCGLPSALNLARVDKNPMLQTSVYQSTNLT